MDARLRAAQRRFSQEPTYANLVLLEVLKRQIQGEPSFAGLWSHDDEVEIEGEPWSATVWYSWPADELYPELIHVMVSDDDWDIEVDVIALIPQEDIESMTEYVWYNLLQEDIDQGYSY